MNQTSDTTLEHNSAAIEEIALDELPQWSPWPKRLIGLEPWSVPVRDAKKVEKEYNVDKYGALLQRFGHTQASMEEIRKSQHDLPGSHRLCISKGSRLYACRLTDAIEMEKQLIRDLLRSQISGCQSIVELGCGYGFNLRIAKSQYPEKKVTGGEFSLNAVKLGQNLGMDVRHFDFYLDEKYDFLAELPPPILVFTCHAIEQIPDATAVVKNLVRFSKVIKCVTHLEPTFELHNDSLLGMMRRRYAEVNDYSRNLVSLLRPFGPTIDKDILGVNPLNPTSKIVWRPQG